MAETVDRSPAPRKLNSLSIAFFSMLINGFAKRGGIGILLELWLGIPHCRQSIQNMGCQPFSSPFLCVGGVS